MNHKTGQDYLFPHVLSARCVRIFVRLCSAVVLSLCLLRCAFAQGSPEPTAASEHTFYLKNATSVVEMNETVTALRNMLSPSSRIFVVPSQSAILFEGPPSQIELATKLLRDLDLPEKLYRLTYTMTDLDDGKRIGVQHFSITVAAGQRTQLKQGNRVPLVTGSAPVAGTAAVDLRSSQITYIDVGLSVDATISSIENGLDLKTKVEVSSIAGEMSSTVSQDPVIRQTLLEGTALLTLGKSVDLGSLDVPGSTRHIRIEVVAEAAK